MHLQPFTADNLMSSGYGFAGTQSNRYQGGLSGLPARDKCVESRRSVTHGDSWRVCPRTQLCCTDKPLRSTKAEPAGQNDEPRTSRFRIPRARSIPQKMERPATLDWAVCWPDPQAYPALGTLGSAYKTHLHWPHSLSRTWPSRALIHTASVSRKRRCCRWMGEKFMRRFLRRRHWYWFRLHK